MKTARSWHIVVFLTPAVTIYSMFSALALLKATLILYRNKSLGEPLPA